MNKLRSLFAQTNGNVVDDNQLCAAVANRLANLFAGKRLQLFRLAANQQDRFGMANVTVRCQPRAQTGEEWFQTE